MSKVSQASSSSLIHEAEAMDHGGCGDMSAGCDGGKDMGGDMGGDMDGGGFGTCGGGGGCM